MKKIAVLTWFNRGRNYGQTLQAFALCHTLEKLGYSYELLSYGKNGPRLSTEEIDQLSGEKRELQIKFVEFIRQHLHFSVRLRDKKSVEQYIMSNDFDAVLCGSDQIWNPFFSFDPVYMLDLNIPHKKVAYAASMVDARLVSEYNKYPQVPSLLKDFDAVSVRENSAHTIVEHLTGGKVDAPVVLDPTMLLTGGEWHQSIEFPPFQHEKYVFCYMYYVTEEQKDMLQCLAHAYGCGAVIFSDLLKSELPALGELRVERAENISIEMFLSMIENSAAVVTDSFHGTAFSIQLEKNFFAVESAKDVDDLFKNGKPRSHIDRIGTLLKKAGLLSRLLRYGTERDVQLTELIDYPQVNDQLAEERKASLNWLEHAIG